MRTRESRLEIESSAHALSRLVRLGSSLALLYRINIFDKFNVRNHVIYCMLEMLSRGKRLYSFCNVLLSHEYELKNKK